MTEKRKNILELVEKRTACAVLESMRKMHKTRNYAGLESAVEELQEYCNRMEDGLWNGKDSAAAAYRKLNKDDIQGAKEELTKRWKNLEDRYAPDDV